MPNSQINWGEELQAIREIIEEFRVFAVRSGVSIETATTRINKLEEALNIQRAEIANMQTNYIRSDERLQSIQKSLDTMHHDFRTIRNSIVASIIAAALIGAGGLVIVSLKSPPPVVSPKTMSEDFDGDDVTTHFLEISTKSQYLPSNHFL